MAEHMQKEDQEDFKASNEGSMAHPDDDVLLAYTREQLDKRLELIVQQHLKRCESCLQKCLQYQEDNRKLIVVHEMRPAYPSIVDDVMQKVGQWRPSLAHRVSEKIYLLRQQLRRSLISSLSQRIEKTERRQPVLRFISLPSAVVLLLLITALVVGIVVWAFSSGSVSSPSGPGSLHPNGGPQTAAVQPKPDPTAKPTSAPSTSGSPTSVPTPSPTKPPTTKPYIYLCSTAADLAQSYMRVCGDNFTAGHRVALFYTVAGSYRITHTVIVDKQKHFEYVFTISNCRSVPGSMFAEDFTTFGVRSQVLTNISYADCPAPHSAGTATPYPRP